MPRGTLYGTERIDRTDPETGLRVRQITSYPTISLHMHYETPTFTTDGKRMIFVSMRAPRRGAPWDLFTCGSDGRDIVQLNDDADDGMGCACLSVDGRYAYYIESGAFHRTRLEDAHDEVMGRIDGGRTYPYFRGSRSANARWYISYGYGPNGEANLIRWDVETGEHVVFHRAASYNHPKANPGGPEFQVGATVRLPDGATKKVQLCIDTDTLEPTPFPFNWGKYGRAHNCWLGRSGRYHATLLPPGRGVIVAKPDGSEPEIVAEGSYFWHSGHSYDGRWIVADTNWPDEGLWLINPATRKRERLCFTGTSAGHPQPTHNHANMNEDGSMAVFTSDRTGITQVYVVYVPEELRERLSVA